MPTIQHDLYITIDPLHKSQENIRTKPPQSVISLLHLLKIHYGRRTRTLKEKVNKSIGKMNQVPKLTIAAFARFCHLIRLLFTKL